jgi:hypothetical protein
MPQRDIENRAAAQDARAESGDDFDKDLERDNRRDSQGGTMADLASPGADAGHADGPLNASGSGTDQGEFPQHARRGQAQSPREETLNQPERHREGHPGGARDS